MTLLIQNFQNWLKCRQRNSTKWFDTVYEILEYWKKIRLQLKRRAHYVTQPWKERALTSFISWTFWYDTELYFFHKNNKWQNGKSKWFFSVIYVINNGVDDILITLNIYFLKLKRNLTTELNILWRVAMNIIIFDVRNWKRSLQQGRILCFLPYAVFTLI